VKNAFEAESEFENPMAEGEAQSFDAEDAK
jgi:hypothetical protein